MLLKVRNVKYTPLNQVKGTAGCKPVIVKKRDNAAVKHSRLQDNQYTRNTCKYKLSGRVLGMQLCTRSDADAQWLIFTNYKDFLGTLCYSETLSSQLRGCLSDL